MSTADIPRCGDTVKHGPSGQEWLVAYADPKRDELSWFGWPEGCAKLSDCALTERCTDEEHAKWVSELLDQPHLNDNGREDMRVHRARELYRPEEQKHLDEVNRYRMIGTSIETLRRLGVTEDILAPICSYWNELGESLVQKS